MTCEHRPASAPGEPPIQAIEIVQQSLDRLEFGTVQLTIHAGKLVQVDVTEKHRFPQ